MHELEQDVLGFSHDTLGAQVAEVWELPAGLQQVIALHHTDEATDRDLPPALRLVAMHHEAEADACLEVLVEEARAMYGLEPDWVRDAVAASREQAADLAQSMG